MVTQAFATGPDRDPGSTRCAMIQRDNPLHLYKRYRQIVRVCIRNDNVGVEGQRRTENSPGKINFLAIVDEVIAAGHPNYFSVIVYL
jgi:hypothetical protein